MGAIEILSDTELEGSYMSVPNENLKRAVDALASGEDQSKQPASTDLPQQVKYLWNKLNKLEYRRKNMQNSRLEGIFCVRYQLN